MSTRCNIHFVDGWAKEGEKAEHGINIYRHSDGYPDGKHGVPEGLQRFFAAVEEQCEHDTRFSDAEYTAAKFVVWQASQFARDPEKPLAFISLGVSPQDHGDIEFVYTVDCGKPDDRGRPTVTWETL